MTLMIQLTDIMFGRGSTCYNNPGNRVFRKVVNEHVDDYKCGASRKKKAALVKLLVSKLESDGYRFLHRSKAGTWVEAPPHLVTKKVGHGLRDARIEAGKINGDVNVLPKNSRLKSSEKKCTCQLKPVITEEAKTLEGMRGEESDNTVVIATGENVGCDASISFCNIHLVQDAPIPEKGQQLLDANANTNLNNAFDSHSMLQEFIPGDGLMDDERFPMLENEIEECFDEHWGCGDHLDKIAEQWPHEYPSTFEMELGLDDLEQSWNDKNEASVLPGVSPCDGATHAAHVVDTLDVALTIYTALYKDSSLSFEDCITDDPYEPLRYDVEDVPSLCRWFSLPITVGARKT